jgi:hypothetical protein
MSEPTVSQVLLDDVNADLLPLTEEPLLPILTDVVVTRYVSSVNNSSTRF